MWYECIDCHSRFDPHERLYICPKCAGLLEIEFDLEELSDKLDRGRLKSEPPKVWKYRAFMPIFDDSKIVTLHEGGDAASEVPSPRTRDRGKGTLREKRGGKSDRFFQGQGDDRRSDEGA